MLRWLGNVRYSGDEEDDGDVRYAAAAAAAGDEATAGEWERRHCLPSSTSRGKFGGGCPSSQHVEEMPPSSAKALSKILVVVWYFDLFCSSEFCNGGR